jgi:hypothetical protein
MNTLNVLHQFYIHMFMHRKSKSINYPKRCDSIQFYLLLQTALHVSGNDATHHQEHIKLHSQHLVLVVVSELLPPAIVVS